MHVSTSPLALNNQRQPFTRKALPPQTPQFSGKHHTTDNFSFQKPGKKSILAALLLGSAGLANAAPINNGLATRNTTSLAEPIVPVAAVNPFASDILPSDLHSVLNPVSVWDMINTDEAQPVETDDKTEKRSPESAELEKPGKAEAEMLESRALTTTQAITILKKPPFKPKVTSVFNNAVYGAPAAAPAPKRSQTVSQLKTELTKAFTKRFHGNTAQVKSAVALMDDAKMKAFVPDARLRAAFVNLQGTSGAAAIDAIRKGVFSTVRFAPLDPSYIAHVITPSGKKPIVEVNSRYQYESIRLISHVLAHEPLHQDLAISKAEELLAHAMDTMVHGRMILEDPTLISKPTEFTQRLNTKLMARLNSRDKAGNLRIFTAQGNVYPGGRVPLANFGANFNEPTSGEFPGITLGASCAGNSVLRGELQKTTGKTNNSANFDTSAEGLIDKYQAVFTPVELVNLANVLKLNTGA